MSLLRMIAWGVITDTDELPRLERRAQIRALMKEARALGWVIEPGGGPPRAYTYQVYPEAATLDERARLCSSRLMDVCRYILIGAGEMEGTLHALHERYRQPMRSLPSE